MSLYKGMRPHNQPPIILPATELKKPRREERSLRTNPLSISWSRHRPSMSMLFLPPKTFKSSVSLLHYGGYGPAQHARGGLTDPPECASCALVSLKKNWQRWAFFGVDLPLEDAMSVLASGSETSYDDGASGEDEDVGKCLGFSAGKTPPTDQG